MKIDFHSTSGQEIITTYPYSHLKPSESLKHFYLKILGKGTLVDSTFHDGNLYFTIKTLLKLTQFVTKNFNEYFSQWFELNFEETVKYNSQW